MKHTPGTWQIRYASGIDYLIRSESGLIVEGKFPSGDIQTMDENENEWHANAKLIAAAPDLLEALKGLSHLMDGREDWPEIIRAKSAIKKATL